MRKFRAVSFVFACFAFMVCFSTAFARRPSEIQHDLGVDLKRRILIASSIKSSVSEYFAHWDGVSDINFENEYSNYLNIVIEIDDRRQFDLETMAFVARLGNGHTKFTDDWLWENSGGQTGLAVDFHDNKWIVLNSQRSEISPGSIISSIDGIPVEQFYAANSKYIAGSNDRSKRSRFFNFKFLFPLKFKLKFSNGVVSDVDRSVVGGVWREPKPINILPSGIFYIPIYSFGDGRVEDRAVEFLKKNKDAKAIIIDVRSNGGGSTPVKLLKALVTKPYKNWAEISALSFGLLKTYGEMNAQFSETSDPHFYGYTEGMKDYFSRSMLYVPGLWLMPNDPIYKNKLIVLVDQACASACEDFVMPLKVTGRAVVVGERTFGSSGQPKIVDFGDGMRLQIGAKRMMFGDGRPFEGVGIIPDIIIYPSAEQLERGDDPVLEKAVDLSSSN